MATHPFWPSVDEDWAGYSGKTQRTILSKSPSTASCLYKIIRVYNRNLSTT